MTADAPTPLTDKLEAKIDCDWCSKKAWNKVLASHRDLERRLSALQADAERYRALCEQNHTKMPRIFPPFREDPNTEQAYNDKASIDAAIDAAREAAPEASTDGSAKEKT